MIKKNKPRINFMNAAYHNKELTPVFLPGESQAWGRLVGCRLWGCTELDTTEVT